MKRSREKMIALIPARAGSKRVPGKNIRDLAGKPLIAYTILAARAVPGAVRVVVSTDSEEIAAAAVRFGADVPFMRPAALAADDVPDRPVIRHALEWFADREDFRPETVLLLRPTTPFKTPRIIEDVISLYEEAGADAVRTVTRVEGADHPYWMFRKGDKDRAVPVIEGVSIDKYYQRQLLPPVFQLNGVADLLTASVVLGDGPLYGHDQRILEIDPLHAVDIDTELDFQFCQFLLEKKIVVL